MNMVTESRIEQAYRACTPRSAELARAALEVLPSGITHDSRHLPPYGPYVERAEGARKHDVDGNSYIDYFGGHGALLLGHNHPAVLKATQAALARGTHFAANHADEIAWARQVIDMVPSARKVRFVASGTEATSMCLRLARAVTGRCKVLRFKGHYHGWQDDMTTGYASHFDGSPVRGVPEGVAANTVLVEGGDIPGLRAAIAANSDIAAAILEPLGAATGMLPVGTEFLEVLREETARAGIVLVFDEVITGFRVSPGGVQGASGVTPDLTSMAKIVAGGLPGGAVAGRADILEQLDFAATRRAGTEKIYHPGTFNANPLSAAAGIATLRIIAGSDACARTEATAATLRAGLNATLAKAGVPWALYGCGTALHVFMSPAGKPIDPEHFDPATVRPDDLKRKPAETVRLLRLAMLVNGVDLSGWPGGLVSAAHGVAEVEATVAAFRESLAMLKRDGVV
jgi:glutamate-1-semialdehyde 2,1-aminomutase